jgi:osmotically-inducible protein OsmY
MRLSACAILVALLPLLPACVPVVATGTGAAVAMTTDRRTAGIYVEDEGIELKSVQRLAERFKNDEVHVNVTSYNRIVLLTGEASTDAAKAEVEKVVRTVPNIRNVYNEVAVAGNSSLAARSTDSYITSKVKTRFIDAQKFNALHVKVVTEAGVVYLMGLVTPQEANDATEIARTTSGVLRVVRMFETI